MVGFSRHLTRIEITFEDRICQNDSDSSSENYPDSDNSIFGSEELQNDFKTSSLTSVDSLYSLYADENVDPRTIPFPNMNHVQDMYSYTGNPRNHVQDIAQYWNQDRNHDTIVNALDQVPRSLPESIWRDSVSIMNEIHLQTRSHFDLYNDFNTHDQLYIYEQFLRQLSDSSQDRNEDLNEDVISLMSDISTIEPMLFPGTPNEYDDPNIHSISPEFEQEPFEPVIESSTDGLLSEVSEEEDPLETYREYLLGVDVELDRLMITHILSLINLSDDEP